MAATCRVIRLEEEVAEFVSRSAKEVEELLTAMADGVDEVEAHRIEHFLQDQVSFGMQISTELTIIGDGAELIRTLASTFAPTDKVMRKVREKRADYEALVGDTSSMAPLIQFPTRDPLEAA